MDFRFISRKDSILISAIEILDEKGIKGMTMKEIAKMEGVTEPAIYRQYKSKKDVIKAILEEFGRYDKQIMDTITQQKMLPEDALRFFCTSLADYYKGYPQVATAMFSFDVFKYDSDTSNIMEKIISNRLEFIIEYVKIGLKADIFKLELEEVPLAEMINGFIMNSTFNWKINNCSYDLKDRVISMFNSIIKN